MYSHIMNEGTGLEHDLTEIMIKQAEKKKYRRDGKTVHRGSDYKGVSKNGNRWQASAMIDNKKEYFG